jgi:hypothetical protein
VKTDTAKHCPGAMLDGSPGKLNHRLIKYLKVLLSLLSHGLTHALISDITAKGLSGWFL